jgi:hypothetical protein
MHTARSGPAQRDRVSDPGDWTVFTCGRPVRCPGLNQKNRHACERQIARVQPGWRVKVRARPEAPQVRTGAQMIHFCKRCLQEIEILVERDEAPAA